MRVEGSTHLIPGLPDDTLMASAFKANRMPLKPIEMVPTETWCRRTRESVPAPPSVCRVAGPRRSFFTSKGSASRTPSAEAIKLQTTVIDSCVAPA